MNMVQSWHKRAFVSPPGRDYSHPATASQSGSKWPKGSRPKKKHPNLCSTIVPANHSPHRNRPRACPLLIHPSRPGFLLLRAVWSLFTEVSVKSAELHTLYMFIQETNREFGKHTWIERPTWLEWVKDDGFNRYLRKGNSYSVRPDPHPWLIDSKDFFHYSSNFPSRSPQLTDRLQVTHVQLRDLFDKLRSTLCFQCTKDWLLFFFGLKMFKTKNFIVKIGRTKMNCPSRSPSSLSHSVMTWKAF